LFSLFLFLPLPLPLFSPFSFFFFFARSCACLSDKVFITQESLLEKADFVFASHSFWLALGLCATRLVPFGLTLPFLARPPLPCGSTVRSFADFFLVFIVPPAVIFVLLLSVLWAVPSGFFFAFFFAAHSKSFFLFSIFFLSCHPLHPYCLMSRFLTPWSSFWSWGPLFVCFLTATGLFSFAFYFPFHSGQFNGLFLFQDPVCVFLF